MTYGLTSNIKKEFPNIPENYHNDFVRGYFDSDNGYHYKEYGNDVVVLHGKSSKLMRQINDIVKGEMIYSKKEWIIISRDFIKFDGYPKDEKRWQKFNI